MNSEFIKRSLYTVFVALAFLISLQFLFNGLTKPDWHDFDVFYYAAFAALSGESIYIIVGQYNLPFWYFPWTAWFFIPFAVLPHDIALILYKSLSVLCAILVVNWLTRYYNPEFNFQDKVLILSLMIPMSLLVMIVGQMEYIFLGLILITMYSINQKKDLLAGLLFPFLWTKPHLLIIFTLFAFWRAGWRTVAISAIFSALMLLVQTFISPGWHVEMLNLLRIGQQRVDGLEFSTFPSLLGFHENWVGTGNLPFTALLIVTALLVVWKFRSLPTIPLLSLALTASVFCAPRAYAYDLPLLIPTMIWLTAREFRSKLWIWFIAALVPLAATFTSSSYLVVLFIFMLGIWKAYKEIYHFKSSPEPDLQGIS
jgi:hypothetical protein